MNSKKVFLLLFFSALQIGCASTSELAKKSDYEVVTRLLVQAETEQAFLEYHKKEPKAFITVTEKAWLGLLANKEIEKDKLIKVSESLPTKETEYISDEVGRYFYQKTAEGYYPAEHEVIFFHLVSSMQLLKQGEKEAARVEARRAAYYLQEDYSQKKPFDSAELRVWLATIWTALGEWEVAKVDLRRAAELSKDYAWVRKWTKQERPPKYLALVLQGTGPTLTWSPNGFDQHMTGRGSLHFEITEVEDKIRLVFNSTEIPLKSPEQTTHWFYKRHQNRNLAIRETLETSEYMVKATAVKTGEYTAKGVGKAVAGALITTGVVVGAVIIGAVIYLAVQLAPSDGMEQSSWEFLGIMAAGGWAAGEGIAKAGVDADKSISSSATKSANEALDLSKSYRFVRYIPSVIRPYFSNVPLKDVRLNTGRENAVEPFLSFGSEPSNVEFFFAPL